MLRAASEEGSTGHAVVSVVACLLLLVATCYYVLLLATTLEGILLVPDS